MEFRGLGMGTHLQKMRCEIIPDMSCRLMTPAGEEGMGVDGGEDR